MTNGTKRQKGLRPPNRQKQFFRNAVRGGFGPTEPPVASERCSGLQGLTGLWPSASRAAPISYVFIHGLSRFVPMGILSDKRWLILALLCLKIGFLAHGAKATVQGTARNRLPQSSRNPPLQSSKTIRPMVIVRTISSCYILLSGMRTMGQNEKKLVPEYEF